MPLQMLKEPSLDGLGGHGNKPAVKITNGKYLEVKTLFAKDHYYVFRSRIFMEWLGSSRSTKTVMTETPIILPKMVIQTFIRIQLQVPFIKTDYLQVETILTSARSTNLWFCD